MRNLTRRTFVAASAALPHAAKSLAEQTAKNASSAKPNLLHVYIGCDTVRSAAKGIYHCTFDPATGVLSQPTLAATTPNPTFMARTGKNIFTANEVKMPDANAISYTAKPDGTLQVVNHVSVKGDGPAHIVIHPSGRAAYVANYAGSSLTSFSVAPDGYLSESVSHYEFQGHGPNAARQQAPHPHASTISPDGRFVLVNDLGLDQIHIYRVDSANHARLTPNTPPNWQGQPGSGPRHLVFHPNGRVVYNLNELASTIDTLSFADGTLKRLAIPVSSLPPEFTGASTAAEIAISPDGLFLYASNRGDDSITVFSIDPHDYLIHYLQRIPSGGKSPRHFTMSPGHDWLLVASQFSNIVTVNKRDEKTGLLTVTQNSIEVPGPMFVLFA